MRKFVILLSLCLPLGCSRASADVSPTTTTSTRVGSPVANASDVVIAIDPAHDTSRRQDVRVGQTFEVTLPIVPGSSWTILSSSRALGAPETLLGSDASGPVARYRWKTAALSVGDNEIRFGRGVVAPNAPPPAPSVIVVVHVT